MAVHNIFRIIARSKSNLDFKLKQAGIKDKPELFVKKTFISSLYMTLGFGAVLFFLLGKTKFVVLVLIFVPILFVMLFFYLLRLPDVRIQKQEKEINKEIIFAIRFLIVEIESGVTFYNAAANLSKNFKVIGLYFREILKKTDMGINIEDALNEVIEINPSRNLQRVLWQILNSLRTGSDIAKSLSTVVEHITREQIIQVEEYSRKLNPLAMFYMVAAVIFPSLGVTIAVIFSNFLNFSLNLGMLLVVVFFVAFMQFMFLAIIKFSRPAVEF